MSKPLKICNPYDVVRVPFPFVEQSGFKVRPALVLSSSLSSRVACSIMAMITSLKGKEPWPSDIIIEQSSLAGLPVPSLVRFKLFTLDHQLILGTIGVLSLRDQENIQKMLRLVLFPV